MTKVKMPEPVAFFYEWELEKNKKPYPDGIAVITVEQAEAYKDACIEQEKGWVSVDDRLPEPGVRVLVYPCGYYNEGGDSHALDFIESYGDSVRWRYHGFLYDNFLGAESIKVPKIAPYTHWTPLPEPPIK